VGPFGDTGVQCENLLEYITGEWIVEVRADFATFLPLFSPIRALDNGANHRPSPHAS
jgi:hypothetical protein